MVLNQAVLVHGFWNEFLYLNHGKFAALVVNGTSVPFSNNLIVNLKRCKTL